MVAEKLTTAREDSCPPFTKPHIRATTPLHCTPLDRHRFVAVGIGSALYVLYANACARMHGSALLHGSREGNSPSLQKSIVNPFPKHDSAHQRYLHHTQMTEVSQDYE